MRGSWWVMAVIGIGAVARAAEGDSAPLSVGGYAEVYWQQNFNDPSNGVTANRAFDDHSGEPALANLVVDGKLDYEGFLGRLALQLGDAPTSYYAAEPGNAALWKHFQQAYGGYRFSALHDLELTGGIFLSPVGPESMVVHESWNWSRSNLFYAVPAYHSGVRASMALSERWSATMAAYTGWNTVKDNNGEKSVEAHVTYTLPTLSMTALYFGGVERPRGAPEGRAWRHLFDAHATWQVTPWLATLLHLDAGLEPNHFGTSSWAAGALYAKVRLVEKLHVTIRGDTFYQRTAENDEGRAAPTFWDGSRVSSLTETLDYRPLEYLSLRLEHRLDRASNPVYFGGAVSRDGLGTAVPNRTDQQTVTLGATAWF